MNSGSLHVVCGPMFSGKSEEMLRLVRRTYYADKGVLVFRPDVDTRDQDAAVVSRAGYSFPATIVKDTAGMADVFLHVGGTHGTIQLVAVDEAQFFDMELANLLDEIADMGVAVVASGLDKDFAGRPFGPMGELLVLADTVTKLTAICAVCKKDATRTQRLIEGKPASRNDPLVVIGGKEDDVYEARCREHHTVAP